MSCCDHTLRYGWRHPINTAVRLSPAPHARMRTPVHRPPAAHQTSADHTTPRYGPVPPVVRGSPGVPLDELAEQEAAAAAGARGTSEFSHYCRSLRLADRRLDSSSVRVVLRLQVACATPYSIDLYR